MCVSQKLKERLKERGDPQMGSVMRCVDEHVVHRFLAQHRGYNMSVDAILAQVGASRSASSNLSRPEEIFDELPPLHPPPDHLTVDYPSSAAKPRHSAAHRYFRAHRRPSNETDANDKMNVSGAQFKGKGKKKASPVKAGLALAVEQKAADDLWREEEKTFISAISTEDLSTVNDSRFL